MNLYLEKVFNATNAVLTMHVFFYWFWYWCAKHWYPSGLPILLGKTFFILLSAFTFVTYLPVLLHRER